MSPEAFVGLVFMLIILGGLTDPRAKTKDADQE